MDPGTVVLEAGLRDGRIGAVRVRVRRPQIAALLVGRPPAEVAQTVPLLYAVCAKAQGAAAAAAIAAARGDPPDTASDPGVAAEAAREQLLAVLTGSARSHLARLHVAIADRGALKALLAELLGVPPERWLALASPQDVDAWAADAAALARECARRLALAEPDPASVRLLAAFEAAQSVVHWSVLEAGFAARPHWAGDACETGPVSRQAARPLVATLALRPFLQRWVARLTELALYALEDPGSPCGRVSAASVGPGRGRSAVETARGMLLHEAMLTGDRVETYVVVAPTEWNFHPDGPARHWLEGAPAASADEALALAQRAVEALDPCVECEFRVG
jgi:hypothetical protein